MWYQFQGDNIAIRHFLTSAGAHRDQSTLNPFHLINYLGIEDTLLKYIVLSMNTTDKYDKTVPRNAPETPVCWTSSMTVLKAHVSGTFWVSALLTAPGILNALGQVTPLSRPHLLHFCEATNLLLSCLWGHLAWKLTQEGRSVVKGCPTLVYNEMLTSPNTPQPVQPSHPTFWWVSTL